MTSSSVPPDAAKQPGAVDETMPDPAAAAGESTADSQGEHDISEAAPAAAALRADLDAAPNAPDVGTGTDTSIEVAPDLPEADVVAGEDVPASSDPAQLVADPTRPGWAA